MIPSLLTFSPTTVRATAQMWIGAVGHSGQTGKPITAVYRNVQNYEFQDEVRDG